VLAGAQQMPGHGMEIRGNAPQPWFRLSHKPARFRLWYQ
jgi:hypothetical protein